MSASSVESSPGHHPPSTMGTTQQQLHRPINPQPIPQISHPQRLPRLTSREAHLHNTVNSLVSRVLVALAAEDILLCLMLLERGAARATSTRAHGVHAQIAVMSCVVVRCLRGGDDHGESGMADEGWDFFMVVDGVFFDGGHAHSYAASVADAGDR